MGLPTDIRVAEASVEFANFKFRTPLVLSSGQITDICQVTARVRVEDRLGRSAPGFGAIFLGDLWAWPSKQVESPQRVDAMKALCLALAKSLSDAAKEHAHPIQHATALTGIFVERTAAGVSKELKLPEPISHLAMSVCFSPLDAAMHDAFGRLHNVSAYQALDKRFLPVNLNAWFGRRFAERHLSEFFQPVPETKIPGWHVISKNDALTRAEEGNRLSDDLPNSLEGWIEREGPFALKVKITGKDIAADVARTVSIYTAGVEIHRRLKTGSKVVLDADSNEASPSIEPVLEYLNRLREASPETYDALIFMEQPTSRDLLEHHIDMRPLAKLKPVLVDEGLQNLSALPVAADLGWSGVALKTCKTHSLTLLTIAWCGVNKWPYAVVDLTNPNLAAVHAAGLGAHCKPIMGVELNCRQFVPQANAALERHMPGLARMKAGHFDLKGLSNIGLGYPSGMIEHLTRS